MGIFKRDAGWQQESWIAIQRCVAETLTRRLVKDGQTVTTAQEADLLADHIADDLMSLEPLVPPGRWVPKPERKVPLAGQRTTVAVVDLLQLHRDLGDLPGPQPSTGAPEAEWDDGMEAAAFDSMIAGMVSRPVEPRDHAYDVRELREALAKPRLRQRLGIRLPTAEALVQALADCM